MHTLTILVLASAAAAAVHATHPAAGSAAARFWEEVLSGTPLPDLISDLVQKGRTIANLLVIFVCVTSHTEVLPTTVSFANLASL
jgi:hypothetical protein